MNGPISSPSPNHGPRSPGAVDILVLHYTGMTSASAALERLCDPTAQVSAHYLIDEDGTIHALVDEGKRAWHAGLSSWRGETDVNSRSIGIELVNPGHEFGYRAFPGAQMEALAELARGIVSRHPISARNVVGHSDVAPARKSDPGELFPWEWLAGQGVGAWPRLGGDPLPSDALAQWGYDVSDMGAAVLAFQRHFRPLGLTGVWDEACGRLLGGLLAA